MKLVFVHGSGGTGRVWKYQTEHFRGSVAVTLPGHPDGTPCESIEAATRWLRSELGNGASSEALALVGHSLGGAIALQYALDYPAEVAGIVLVGSGARLRVHPATLKALEKSVAHPESFGKMFEDTFQKVSPEFAAELRARSVAVGPAPFLADLRACDRFDVVDRLGAISAPTLAIAGTEDVMTPPKYSTFLEERMPNASARIIDGGTHFVFAEYPDEVNQAIADFIASLATS
ncbi:MAG: alpha/beta hydrolase [Proteobacteria bacterium]|nr:alpha/beta hydrolase [Pseudomonadota bacterium]